MLWGTAGEECDTRFVVVAVFQPLRLFNPLALRALPLYGCAAQGERIEK